MLKGHNHAASLRRPPHLLDNCSSLNSYAVVVTDLLTHLFLIAAAFIRKYSCGGESLERASTSVLLPGALQLEFTIKCHLQCLAEEYIVRSWSSQSVVVLQQPRGYRLLPLCRLLAPREQNTASLYRQGINIYCLATFPACRLIRVLVLDKGLKTIVHVVMLHLRKGTCCGRVLRTQPCDHALHVLILQPATIINRSRCGTDIVLTLLGPRIRHASGVGLLG